MIDPELLKQGAEARIYKGVYLGQPAIAKERFVKKYRHTILDQQLTKERIKAEARAIVKCKTCGVRTPAIYLVDLNRRTIFMEYFANSITLKDFINTYEHESSVVKIANELGRILGKMHAGNIVHGDLTTSNVLLVNKNNENKFECFADLHVVFIDFGLAHLEASTEDKGVDLYVLERAINSTHSTGDALMSNILLGYQQSYKSGFKQVLAKYEDVRARGRKRTMVG